MATKRILIADDDFVTRQLLGRMLREEGEVDAAANGREAIEAYNLAVERAHPYDLILLDVAMPGCDGVDVLKKIRETEERAGIAIGDGVPVIMITAYEEPVFESFKDGCDDYIIKPFEAEKVIAKVRESLGK